MLEKLVGKRVPVVVENDFGCEGELGVISHHPPSLWLSEAEAIVLRSTVVNPNPWIVSKEKKAGTLCAFELHAKTRSCI
jgi:hypothetical protein